jgi:hypothetical protein
MLSCVLLLLLLAVSLAHAEEPTFEYFPARKLFPHLTADGLAHQLSLSRVTENHDWIAAIGGAIPMAQLNLTDAKIQGGVAVTIFNRLVKTPGKLEVYTVDYKVDIPFDIRLNDFTLRFALGHISCHFADDAIEIFGKRSIQHVNDYFTVAAAYDVEPIRGYVYGGFNYSYGTQPIQHKPWLLQVGAHFGNVEVHEDILLYGALDVKVREENGWGSTRSIQIGARFFPHHRVGARLAYTHREGFEERGQFYLNTTTLNLISAFIDF